MLAVLISVLLITLFRKGGTEVPGREGHRRASGKKMHEEESLRHCPICKSPLAKGEKVKSVLYPGEIDRMMEIYGCPHCYPPNHSNPRVCPVCSRIPDSNGIIYARYFRRQDGAHVHVLGCTSCYTRRN